MRSPLLLDGESFCNFLNISDHDTLGTVGTNWFYHRVMQTIDAD